MYIVTPNRKRVVLRLLREATIGMVLTFAVLLAVVSVIPRFEETANPSIPPNVAEDVRPFVEVDEEDFNALIAEHRRIISLMNTYPFAMRFPCTDESWEFVYEMIQRGSLIPERPWTTTYPFEPGEMCAITFWTNDYGPVRLVD